MVARRKGAVINIASIGSYYPGAYLAEYIATKHYMHSFTEVKCPLLLQPFIHASNLAVPCLGAGGYWSADPRDRSRRRQHRDDQGCNLSQYVAR